ncbi:hypothetical protein HYC85_005077 [Camellia sinensis]|uniref:FAD-binding domain-containing protein n=1 Tax=Camellia sinensis TaxID=4442 RepID=A0A7J7HYE5_CAMSI|nr:hypothetical protein HYC85_005077 [Camellia sinensis]
MSFSPSARLWGNSVDGRQRNLVVVRYGRRSDEPGRQGFVCQVFPQTAPIVRGANIQASPGEAGTRVVHRKALLEALAEELSTDTIRFNSNLTSIEAQNQDDSSIVVVRLHDGTEIKTKVLIGCDGVNSVVARWLGLGAAVDSGRSAVRGLAVYPQGHGFKHDMQQYWSLKYLLHCQIPLNNIVSSNNNAREISEICSLWKIHLRT